MAGKPRQDPRREKRLEFRHRGMCRRSRCGLCHWEKRYRIHKGPRAAQKASLKALAQPAFPEQPIEVVEGVEKAILRQFRMTPLARKFAAYDTTLEG